MNGLRNCVGWMLVAIASTAANAATVEMQRSMNTNTFEVVMKKPEKDPLTYEKPLPLELLPYLERTDAYRSIGTAFALGNNTYVTAAHVLLVGINSQFGVPALRDASGKVYAIDQLIKFSQHEDFTVFTVVGDSGQGLGVNRTPKINDAVFAVGNALGDGVVIRDGLFTSETPEDQDGRWKWIRFSAPASPGNSGGPLVDANGDVIGVVIGKSPNENLNYSLPISRVLDAPANKALFDSRYLATLPFLHGRSTQKLKDEFALPKTWSAFASAYREVITRDSKQARKNLLAEYRDGYFPAKSDDVLYDNDGKFDPRLIMQQHDGRWTSDSVDFGRTDLPKDGFVKVGFQGSISLFRLHRPDKQADTHFYRDSKAPMDLMLKGLHITRSVGTDAVVITSLGAAQQDDKVTDAFGRIWQRRIWALPHMDNYVIANMLPTPEGYVGFLQLTGSAGLNEAIALSDTLVPLIDFAYVGSLEQWQHYLKQRDLIPAPLASLQVNAFDTHGTLGLKATRLQLDVPSKLLTLNKDSVLAIDMGYAVDVKSDLNDSPLKNSSSNSGNALSWDIGAIRLFSDLQYRAYIKLIRHARPPSSAKHELLDDWNNLQARRSPYNEQPTRESTDTFTASATVTVNSRSSSNKISDSLAYSLTLGIDNYKVPDDLRDRMRLARESLRILEKGEGAIEANTPLSDTDQARLKELAAAFSQAKNAVKQLTAEFIPPFAQQMRSLRNATTEAEISEYLFPEGQLYKVQSIEKAFNIAVTEQNLIEAEANLDSLRNLMTDTAPRYQTIGDFYRVLSTLAFERRLWSHITKGNGLPLEPPHDVSVSHKELALNQALAHSALFSSTQLNSARDLAAAMATQRTQLISHLASDSERERALNYQARKTTCNDIGALSATQPGSNTAAKVSGPIPNTDDYYPATSRREGEEGSVVVAALVDTRGCPMQLGVLVSSGWPSLDSAALTYVENLHYQPALRDGKPIESKTRLKVSFILQL